MKAALGRVGRWSRRKLLVRKTRVRVRPAQPGPRPAAAPVTGADIRPARVPVRARRAIPLLAVMTAVAVALVWATVSIAMAGFAANQAASSVVAGPLLVPAPRTAANLPRRFGASIDPAALPIAADFHQRFAAVSARLVAAAERGLVAAGNGAARSGTTGTVPTGRKITAVIPSALYGEPGHLDPVTDRTAWILYLGLQATGNLGQPRVSVTSLMTGILGPLSRVKPWQVPAGHRGGAASCTVAWLARTEMSVCGWATDRTIGALASPLRDTSVSELATLMVEMRFSLQHC